MISERKILQTEEISRLCLQQASQPIMKEVFIAQLTDLISHEAALKPSPSHIKQCVKDLRLTGLFKRNYYQITILGTYFLEFNLDINSYFTYFHKNLAMVLQRKQTQRISSEQFFQVYIACGRWYIHVMQEKDFAGPDFLMFLSVLCRAFEWTEEIPQVVKKQALAHLDESLTQKYRQRIAKNGEEHFLSEFTSRKDSKPSSFEFQVPPEIEVGRVLKKVTHDIYYWLIESLLNKDSKFYAFPYFNISKYAIAARMELNIPIQNYARSITWIMEKEKLTPKDSSYLEKLGTIKDWEIKILDAVTRIRTHCSIQYLKHSPQKERRILVFITTKKTVVKTFLHHNTRLLNYVCGDCVYFEPYKKKDCLLFRRLELLYRLGRTNIPSEVNDIYKERIQPLFSTRVACSFWRSNKPFQTSVNQIDQTIASCVYCYQPLPALPTPEESVLCSCESEYQYVSPQKARYGIYICQLTEQHSMGHDLALINPQLLTLADDPFKTEEGVLPQANQIFNPETDSCESMLYDTSHYVFIDEDSQVLVDPTQHLLKVDDQSYDLREITLIDTQKKDYKWKKDILKKIKNYPQLRNNFRPFNVTLSPLDKATIITSGSQAPILRVKKPQKKETECYPLHQLSVVFNVGKPRLNAPLKQWHVQVLYTSTKGIAQTPKTEIKQAIQLPGVRPVLQKHHLQGLIISLVCATVSLVECIKKFTTNNEEGDIKISKREKLLDLSENLIKRMKFLLDQPTDSLFDIESSIESSFKRVGLVEARFSRPFAEGIRSFMNIIQDETAPLLTRGYGRTVARRVKKRQKYGRDYMGGYTPFDSALTCINRTLRYRLRIWNAKVGLGFYCIPLFVHTSKDKPGRAGHLDLEEVTRIISRITLINAILDDKIKSIDFITDYDDDFLPYYVPTRKAVRRLRFEVVRKKVFPTRIFYQGKWMTLSKAHKVHVQHLCWCLEESLKIRDIHERVIFLQETYQPLIYLPEFTSSNKELFRSFKHNLFPLISDSLHYTITDYLNR